MVTCTLKSLTVLQAQLKTLNNKKRVPVPPDTPFFNNITESFDGNKNNLLMSTKPILLVTNKNLVYKINSTFLLLNNGFA